MIRANVDEAEKGACERFGRGHNGSVATVTERVKTTDGASNHGGAEVLHTGLHLIITSAAKLEETLM